MRAGDSRVALSQTHIARETYIDEIDPASGIMRQSIRLPDGGPTWNAATGSLTSLPGCTTSSQYYTDGMLTLSGDGLSAVAACFAQPIGTALNGTGARHIIRIGYDGTVTSGSVFASGASQIRGAATFDHSYYWVGTIDGVLGVRGGLNPGVGNLTSSTYLTPSGVTYRMVSLMEGGLYAVGTGGMAPVVLIGGAGMANNAPTASPAPAPTAVPGLPLGLTGGTNGG